MAESYLIVSGQLWGLQVFAQLDPERFALVTSPADLRQRDLTQYRYAFFLNWSALVPRDVLDEVECVNFHCTRLPYGRGGHPIENLILRGHTETVITAHMMTEELDAGPIYAVSPSLSLAGTKDEIRARFVAPVRALIEQLIETEPDPVPQDGAVTIFHRLSREEFAAVWAKRLPA